MSQAATAGMSATTMFEDLGSWFGERTGIMVVLSGIGALAGQGLHEIGADAWAAPLIGRVWGAIPGESFPSAALIGAIGVAVGTALAGVFKILHARITLDMTHKHELAMKQFEYDHEEQRKDHLKAKLREHNIDFEDSADEPTPKHTA